MEENANKLQILNFTAAGVIVVDGLHTVTAAHKVRWTCVLTRRMERTAWRSARLVIDPAKFRKQLKTHYFSLLLNVLYDLPTTVFFGDRIMQSDRCLSCPVCLSACLSVCLSVTLVYCCQTLWRIKVKLGVQVGLGPGHIVLDGDPASLPQRGTTPSKFAAHIRCGKMAA